jgi:hypothetical protein
MTVNELLRSSGHFPTYLNWETSGTKYWLPNKASAQFVDFSCVVNEFSLYQEPLQMEPNVVYK